MSDKIPEQNDSVAIIGMAGRFPGAGDINQLWSNLINGVESITFFTDEELMKSGINTDILKSPDYIKSRPYLRDIDMFDAEFFDYSPKEAVMMDPQHRIFMESAWASIEDAGYVPDNYDGRIGLYAACDSNTYLLQNILNQRITTQSDMLQLKMNDKDYLCTRTSYKMNLRGPSMMVQSACSSALVAVHLAGESLLSGECDMALAGAVSITLPQKTGYFYEEGGVVSKDGHCRTFDAEASGTVYGDGVGVVVLKRLSEAIQDNDHIYAVIRGSAINNDGGERVGYAAPGIMGQRAVVEDAISIADVSPETIGYIEAHGTGTNLGDIVEIEALTQAFRSYTNKKQFCAIGSIKTNIGHCSTASGMAGFIKTALALKNKKIPATLNYKKSNPKINFEDSPFYVANVGKHWESDEVPHRAGVSAFGLGGANAHIILEEAPIQANLVKESSGETRAWNLFLLSAKTSEGIKKVQDNLKNYLSIQKEIELANVAYTLQTGRKGFGFRKGILADSVECLIEKLNCDNSVSSQIENTDSMNPKLVFMFPGLGHQYINLTKDLYEQQSLFRKYFDQCIKIGLQNFHFDIRDILFQEDHEKRKDISGGRYDLSKVFGTANNKSEFVTEKLERPSYAYLIMFSVEYSLAKALMAIGVQPHAMLGHSIGEYVSACLAEVFSLEHALHLIWKRGRLIETLPNGGMLSVMLPEEKLMPHLHEGISICIVNSPTTCVVGGAKDDIDGLERNLLKEGIACKQVLTDYAFHSNMMLPILDEFREFVREIPLNAPKIPYISNVTGDFVLEHEVTEPDYWVKHLYMPVLFSKGIQMLLREPENIYLELGPGNVLGSLIMQHQPVVAKALKSTIASLGSYFDNQSDQYLFLSFLNELWMRGIDIDWNKLNYGEGRCKVSLPTYPFEKKRFWNHTLQAGLFSLHDKPKNDIQDAKSAELEDSLLVESQSFPVEQQTKTEAVISAIWTDILGIPLVGLHDDFFEIGGNSLTAVKLIFEIKHQLKTDIPMVVFMNQPTIFFLSNYVDTIEWAGTGNKDKNLSEDDKSEGTWDEIEI